MRVPAPHTFRTDRDKAIAECLQICTGAVFQLQDQSEQAPVDDVRSILEGLDENQANALIGTVGVHLMEQACVNIFKLFSEELKAQMDAEIPIPRPF